MAYLDKVSLGGTTYDVNDTKGRAMIAPKEATSTASAAHAAGSYFTYNDLLYRATADIASGGTITPNTNCVAVTVGGDVGDLKSAINYIEPKYISGYYIHNSGEVNGDGTGNRKMSEHIPCIAGIVVHYMGETNHTLISALTFYKLDGTVLETHVNEGPTDTEYSATAPTDTAYCILSSRDTMKTEIWFSSSPILYTILKAQEDIESLGEEIIPTERIENNAVTPSKTSFFEQTSHNLINPANITASLYWSPGSSAISTGSAETGNMLTEFIEVIPGETYTISGTACTNMGGYFAADALYQSGQAGTPITFFAPVTGGGYCFTVPESGVKYVALDISKNTTTQEPNGTFQLELGEMATPIVPYNLIWKIEKKYLPEQEGQTTTNGIDSLPSVSYDSVEKAKLSDFFEHCRNKDKDIVVVGTGTSLTARSSEHCTTRDDATSRPPLMHANNFASKMWDIMRWEGQQYRRFDYPGFFTEIGTWASTHNLSGWDDGNYRYGLTRYASGNASVKFTIPKNAWQFNFIYRSDTSGSESVSVTVAEGNGKVEVFNGSTWEEANGYTFSMKQVVTELSNISVCDPNTVENSAVSIESYQVGGNTTYQKRLKMRCKSGSINSLASTKEVTISSSSGRLLYWGVEWSPREFMITYINAARGSHNMTYSSELSLSHYQDNEIWDFKPDVIFTEIPIHNSGAAGTATNLFYTTYWGYATDDFFFNTDNPISFVSRATAKGINVSNLEWVIFTSSLSYNFNGIDEDGELIVYIDKSGKAMSALDAQTLTYEWLKENKNFVVAINACKYWCDAGVQLFGDMKTATLGSGKDGYTFTNEGSHWNDTGSAVIAKCVGGSLRDYD